MIKLVIASLYYLELLIKEESDALDFDTTSLFLKNRLISDRANKNVPNIR